MNIELKTKAKVAVIGAGPAGLSCAQTLLDLGYQVDIFDVNNFTGVILQILHNNHRCMFELMCNYHFHELPSERRYKS